MTGGQLLTVAGVIVAIGSAAIAWSSARGADRSAKAATDVLARSATAHETIAAESAKREAAWEIVDRKTAVNRTGDEAYNVRLVSDNPSFECQGCPFDRVSPGASVPFFAGVFSRWIAAGHLDITWERPDGSEATFRTWF